MVCELAVNMECQLLIIEAKVILKQSEVRLQIRQIGIYFRQMCFWSLCWSLAECVCCNNFYLKSMCYRIFVMSVLNGTYTLMPLIETNNEYPLSGIFQG